MPGMWTVQTVLCIDIQNQSGWTETLLWEWSWFTAPLFSGSWHACQTAPCWGSLLTHTHSVTKKVSATGFWQHTYVRYEHGLHPLSVWAKLLVLPVRLDKGCFTDNFLVWLKTQWTKKKKNVISESWSCSTPKPYNSKTVRQQEWDLHCSRMKAESGHKRK